MNARKELYKLFYQAERSAVVGSTSRASGWKVLNLTLDAIRMAYQHEYSQGLSLRDLFEAQAAATSAIIERRKPELKQSERLTAALAKFRGVEL